MDNFFSKHLATCFFTIIGLIFILSIILSTNIANVNAIVNGKADTLLVNKTFYNIREMMFEISDKQDTMIKYQKINNGKKNKQFSDY